MNLSDFLLGGSGWWVLPCSMLTFGATFGLLPGLMLRLIVLLYPKGHPRREELFGELYDPDMGRMARFEWVFQTLETALRQGPACRKRARAERRANRAPIDSADNASLPPGGEIPRRFQVRISDETQAKFDALSNESNEKIAEILSKLPPLFDADYLAEENDEYRLIK